MKRLSHRWTQSEHFLPTPGNFFQFSKKGRGHLPHPSPYPPPPPPPPLVKCRGGYFMTMCFLLSHLFPFVKGSLELDVKRLKLACWQQKRLVHLNKVLAWLCLCCWSWVAIRKWLQEPCHIIILRLKGYIQ